MGDCEDCGTPVDNKNAAGHYRDYCLSCLHDRARRTLHVDTCEREDCPVCHSHPAGDADGIRYEHLDVEP